MVLYNNDKVLGLEFKLAIIDPCLLIDPPQAIICHQLGYMLG